MIIVIMCEIIVTMCVLIAIMCVIIGAIIVIMCDDCDRPVPSPQPRSLLSSAPSSAPLLPQPRSMVLRFLRVEEFVRGGRPPPPQGRWRRAGRGQHPPSLWPLSALWCLSLCVALGLMRSICVLLGLGRNLGTWWPRRALGELFRFP